MVKKSSEKRLRGKFFEAGPGRETRTKRKKEKKKRKKREKGEKERREKKKKRKREKREDEWLFASSFVFFAIYFHIMLNFHPSPRGVQYSYTKINTPSHLSD